MKKILSAVSIMSLMGCGNDSLSPKMTSIEKPTLPKIGIADFNPDKNLTDEQILALAQLKMDDPLNAKLPKAIGNHHNVPVVFEQICSDFCPNYTVRLIHYQLSSKQTCQSVNGVEETLIIPVAIAAVKQKFCFPKIITDNWSTYQHSHDNFAEIKEK